MSVNQWNLSQQKQETQATLKKKMATMNFHEPFPNVVLETSNKSKSGGITTNLSTKTKIYRNIHTDGKRLDGSAEDVVTSANIKSSQSMNSLPPFEKQDARDVIKAKLRNERPYNSLKKNATGNSVGSFHSNKRHRYSWGSGHSSSSLHSTTFNFGSGKDDLWAAIQTNYNYIMDTNLLDSCKEARYEIEGNENVMENPNNRCFKIMHETNRREFLNQDPKELRKWLREMELKIENAPSLSEATLFSVAELERQSANHSVLYHEIVSHARVVSACIRAASEKDQQQLPLTSNASIVCEQNNLSLSSNDETFTSIAATDKSSNSSGVGEADNKTPERKNVIIKKSEENLDRLQNRYHLLYLKAFEVQLWLDGLLRKKTSSVTEFAVNGALSDCEFDAIEDNLNDVISDLETNVSNHCTSHCNFPSYNSSQNDKLKELHSFNRVKTKGDCEDGDDEEDEEENDSRLLFPRKSNPNLIYSKILINVKDKKSVLPSVTVTDFEADSESSDFEAVKNLRRQRRLFNNMSLNKKHTHEQKSATSKNIAKITFAINNKRKNFTSLSVAGQLYPSVAFDIYDAAKKTDDTVLVDTKNSTDHQRSPVKTFTTLTEEKKTAIKSEQQTVSASRLDSYKSIKSIENMPDYNLQTQSTILKTNENSSVQHQNNKKCITAKNHKNIAIITPNTHSINNNNNNKNNNNTSSGMIYKCRQQHHLDISKFNRSNRKSKNCGIFYFKHLDTDNETYNDIEGDSNEADSVVNCSTNDLLKSAEASSDDESWLYSSSPTQIECLNLSKRISSTVVESTQSAAITSFTVNSPTKVGSGIDLDGESRKIHATSTINSLLSLSVSTQTSPSVIELVANSLPSTPKIETSTRFIEKTNVISSSCSSSKSSNYGSSSYSSNDFLTEATTSATTTTQIAPLQPSQTQHCKIYIAANNFSNTLINDSNKNFINENGPSNTNQIQYDDCTQRIDQVVQHKLKIVENSQNLDINKKGFTSNSSQDDNLNLTTKPPADTLSAQKLPHIPKTHIPQCSLKIPKQSLQSSKEEIPHDSGKEVILKTERENSLITPARQKQSIVKISSTVKKRKLIMPGPIQQRVQEWLELQPSSQSVKMYDSVGNNAFIYIPVADDCEASSEASETESLPCSDTSEGLTDSIATCMQASTTSHGNSAEIAHASAGFSNALYHENNNQNLNIKINKRQQTHRKSERPWSVSCLSQLTSDTNQNLLIETTVDNIQVGLASHSISESALDYLSPEQSHVSYISGTQTKNSKGFDSKGSLKRRKSRKKKLTNIVMKTDSVSEEVNDNLKLTQGLSGISQQKSEKTNTLTHLTNFSCTSSEDVFDLNEPVLKISQTELHRNESEEDLRLMKPSFRVGSYTTSYMKNEACLGSLAALASYMNDEEPYEGCTTGPEDYHSSFSETAWDNYQEKYNSENYSEGFDSDAARRLLEFGDDYRNFLDSQSDCCSSLSAANNLDSLSPPRMDSFQLIETKTFTQESISNSVDHARRRRALELEFERRRKNLEVRRRSGQETVDNANRRNLIISVPASSHALTPKNIDKINFYSKGDSANRKPEFGKSPSSQSLRRTSESDNSMRRRKADERRRSSRNLEKSIKVKPATSSSSGDDTDEEREMRNFLHQSRSSLEATQDLKNRCHLLRPEDYTEIINTCRDNIRCLESVLHGPPGTILSAQCVTQTKDLLKTWDDLLVWCENASTARKLQEEMIILRNALSRLGNKSSLAHIDTESSIQIAIELLENEKIKLQNYRISMLHLNASVHSWLTSQERKLQSLENQEIQQQKLSTNSKQKTTSIQTTNFPITTDNIKINEFYEKKENATTKVMLAESSECNSKSFKTDTSATENIFGSSDNDFQKNLKVEVSDMYSAWDDADERINSQLEILKNSLIAWQQLESGLFEFQQALGQDRGTLQCLEGVLNNGESTQVELERNVKLVAKLLSEKLTTVQEHLDPLHLIYFAKYTASSGSLSDSGISDGGTTSDGGLSERERRLGVLRRLAKQLESALAPASVAMKVIGARMESAEAELKILQNTCRDLIVRTATTHQNKIQQLCQFETVQTVDSSKCIIQSISNPKSNECTESKKSGKFKRQGQKDVRQQHNNKNIIDSDKDKIDAFENDSERINAENDTSDTDVCLPNSYKKNWRWRIAKVAIPMQLVLLMSFCAACIMQPNCCDNLNNLSMSFTPQLRYMRGPPPI